MKTIIIDGIEYNLTPKERFKEGDWVIFNEHHNSVYQVEKIQGLRYYLRHYLGGTLSVRFDTELIRKWTLQDAKSGDVLVDKYNNIGIYKEIEGIYWDSYIYLGCDGKLYDFSVGGMHDQTQTHPATKGQRDNLLKAMAEAGWDFDFEKKELKKIKPIDEYEGLTDFERAVVDACIGFIDKDLVGWKQYVKDSADDLLKIAVKKFNAVQDDSIQINPSEYINDMGGNGCYLKNTAQVSAWSEEDAEMVEGLNNCLDELEEENGWKYVYVKDKNVELTEIRNWMKALKDRVQPQQKQEWNDEDEKEVAVLEAYIRSKDWSERHIDRALGIVDELVNKAKSLKSQPKQEWSEDDEGICRAIINDIANDKSMCTFDISKGICDKKINWLKLLKERVACEANCTTTKQRSEDEESIINKAESWLDTLCDYLKDSSPEYISDIKDVINKLKSIKDRYTWKPSSIQMECLHDAIEHYHTNGYPATKLTELYEQMSKTYKL